MLAPLTWNADSNLLSPGKRLTQFFSRQRNYLARDLSWKRINPVPREAGGSFTISEAPYYADIPVVGNGWTEYQSTNTYDIWDKAIRNDQPVGIAKRWICSPIRGIPTAQGILYPLAFPELNADRLVQTTRTGIKDLVVFYSEPPGNGLVKVPLEIDFGSLDLIRDKGYLSFSSGGDFRGVSLKPPRAWDSRGRIIRIELEGKIVGTRWIGFKVIPRQFFAGAAYPVYADTVSTFYPDPNPETTSVDGYIQRSGTNLTWADIYGGVGTEVADSTTVERVAAVTSDTTTDRWQRLRRGVLLFDTSSLSDVEVTSAATLNLMASSKDDGRSLSLNVVSSAPAGNTSLATGDYGSFGATRFSDSDVSTAGFTTDVYRVITLNSSGCAAVSLNGITKFGVRYACDIDNSPPAWTGVNVEDMVYMYFADTSGTGSDPYLSVTSSVSLSASVGSFTLSGQVSSLKYSRQISASSRAYSWSGIAAGLLRTARLVAVDKSYQLDGIAAGLTLGRKLTAVTTTYVLTGIASSYIQIKKIAADIRTYTLTGIAATLSKGGKVIADVRSYTLTGVAAGLRWTRILTAVTATYVWTGIAATLARGRPLITSTGVFVLTGIAASLRQTGKIAVEVSAYVLTGKAAGTYRGYKAIGAVAAYVLTGIAALLQYGKKLTAVNGIFTETGIDSSLRHGHVLMPEVRSYDVVGFDTGLYLAHTLPLSVGTFTQTGIAASLVVGRAIAGATGTFTLTGIDAGVRATYVLVGATGSYVETGVDAGLFRTYTPLSASLGTFILSGLDAVLGAVRQFPAESTSFAITGYSGSLIASRGLIGATGVYTATGIAATFMAPRLLVTSTGVFILTGKEVGLSPGNLRGHLIHAVLSLTPRIRGQLVFEMKSGTTVRTGHLLLDDGGALLLDDGGYLLLHSRVRSLRGIMRVAPRLQGQLALELN